MKSKVDLENQAMSGAPSGNGRETGALGFGGDETGALGRIEGITETGTTTGTDTAGAADGAVVDPTRGTDGHPAAELVSVSRATVRDKERAMFEASVRFKSIASAIHGWWRSAEISALAKSCEDVADLPLAAAIINQ